MFNSRKLGKKFIKFCRKVLCRIQSMTCDHDACPRHINHFIFNILIQRSISQQISKDKSIQKCNLIERKSQLD